MTLTAPTLENLTLNVAHEIHVRASLDATFDALLEQMGPANETPDGGSLPMTIEPWPGGRWFRDLGERNGHFCVIMLNHWYHHRGQLSVYLRQLGVPVPSIYGPSADENPFLTREKSAVAV